jgi:hypothetical protein
MLGSYLNFNGIKAQLLILSFVTSVGVLSLTAVILNVFSTVNSANISAEKAQEKVSQLNQILKKILN